MADNIAKRAVERTSGCDCGSLNGFAASGGKPAPVTARTHEFFALGKGDRCAMRVAAHAAFRVALHVPGPTPRPPPRAGPSPGPPLHSLRGLWHDMRIYGKYSYESEKQRLLHPRDRRGDVVDLRVRAGLDNLQLELLQDKGRGAPQDEASVQVPEQGQARGTEARAHPRRARAKGQEADSQREKDRGPRGRVRPPRDGGEPCRPKKTAGEG